MVRSAFCSWLISMITHTGDSRGFPAHRELSTAPLLKTVAVEVVHPCPYCTWPVCVGMMENVLDRGNKENLCVWKAVAATAINHTMSWDEACSLGTGLWEMVPPVSMDLWGFAPPDNWQGNPLSQIRMFLKLSMTLNCRGVETAEIKYPVTPSATSREWAVGIARCCCYCGVVMNKVLFSSADSHICTSTHLAGTATRWGLRCFPTQMILGFMGFFEKS